MQREKEIFKDSDNKWFITPVDYPWKIEDEFKEIEIKPIRINLKQDGW